MFGWLFKAEKRERAMVGDLDLLARRDFYIKYQGREWRVKELTAGEYAEMCAITADIEKRTADRNPEGVDDIYADLISLNIPSMSRRMLRKMSLLDTSALVSVILKHYGADMEKKKIAQ